MNIFFGQVLCPHAGCGFIALLCLFQRSNINFCPLKFIQKCAVKACDQSLSCTRILNDVEEWGFIKKIYGNFIDEGKHKEELHEAEKKLKNSNQKAGLLWFSTAEYSHCVTVYLKSPETKMEIEDGQFYINYLTDPHNVTELKLLILVRGDNDEPQIKNEWSNECHADICNNEFQQLSKTGNSLPQKDRQNEVV